MNKIYLQILCAMVVLLFTACDNNKTTLEPIDGNIWFYMQADSVLLGQGDGQYILRLTTSEIYNCANYIIISNNLIGNSLVQIEILGSQLSGDECLTALGLAKANIELNRKSGSFTLVIAKGNLTDRYQVTLNDSVLVTAIDSSYTIYGMPYQLYD